MRNVLANLILGTLAVSTAPATARAAQAYAPLGSVTIQGQVVAGVPPRPTAIGLYTLDAPPNVGIRQVSPVIVEVTGNVGGTLVTAHLAPVAINYGVGSPAPASNYLMAAVGAWGTQGQQLKVHETMEYSGYDPNFPNLRGSMAAAIYDQPYAQSRSGMVHGQFLLHVSPSGQAMAIDAFTDGSLQQSGQDGDIIGQFLLSILRNLRSPG
jgi:hypothetical protein